MSYFNLVIIQTVHPTVRFLTAYGKKCSKCHVTTGAEMVSLFVDISVDDVLLQTNTDFTSHFLNSSTFQKVLCCVTVKLCNRITVRGHMSEDMKFIEVFFPFQCTDRLFWFFQVMQKQTLGEVRTRTVF